MECSLSLNDANYLSRIFTAAAQISAFLVLKSFKIFHDKKYFSFSVWSLEQVGRYIRGVKTCFINGLEYMAHNSRLHFIRTLILTSPWKLYMRINTSVPSAKSQPRHWRCWIYHACSICISILSSLYYIGHCHNCSHLIVKSSVMIFSCLALDPCNPSLVLISLYQLDSFKQQMLPTVATNWAIFWYYNP